MSDHNKETEARCPHCYRHYVEGTAAWALYMMRMGHKVTNPKYDPRVYHLPEGDMIHVNGIKSIATNQWIDYWCIDLPDGWQLYEEPEYKVGDYIKNGGDYYIVTSPTTCVGLRYGLSHEICPKTCKIVSPSEVIVHIGCLSGTVEKAQDYAYFLLWHSKTDCDYSMIKWSALDAPTRSLVESLLKAQEEANE